MSEITLNGIVRVQALAVATTSATVIIVVGGVMIVVMFGCGMYAAVLFEAVKEPELRVKSFAVVVEVIANVGVVTVAVLLSLIVVGLEYKYYY